MSECNEKNKVEIMGQEDNSATSSSSPSASVKRSRDPEDEVYVDNLRSHKRYLSEIMASSLNGLTVGDSLSENLMDSPIRSENMMHGLRDELSVPYSPMSEDSDDSRYYEPSSFQPDSAPTSPVSPHRGQKPLRTYFPASPTTSYPCNTSNNNNSSAMSSHPRQRGSDSTEGRFPSSPSDICHSSDLRKTALLRSVQMRTQPLGSSSPLSPGRESGSNSEGEETACPYMKLDVDERVYRVGECAPLGLSEREVRDKSIPNGRYNSYVAWNCT